MARLTLTGLGIADTRGSFVTRPLDRVELTWGGIEGDRHFGMTMKSGVRQKHHPRNTELRNARQLSILSAEELAQIAAALQIPRVAYEWLGGNLCFAGDERLSAMPPSTRLLFPSGACLVVDGENEPCRGPGKVVQEHFPQAADVANRFVKAALHRRGLVAWVERPGLIETGNAVELIQPR